MILSWKKIYAKSENIKAYTLLFPALLLVILAMASPMLLTFVTSFHTQISMMEVDTTLTFDRYKDFFSKPVYTTLLARSIKISFFVTIVTLVTTYPLAYYIAFYVKKNKMLWIELDTQLARHSINWQWIKGHLGHIHNEQADCLARRFIEEN